MAKGPTPKRRPADPAKGARDVRGEILGKFMEYTNGDPNVLLDPSRAVLMDGMDVCRVMMASGVTDNTARGKPQMRENIAMSLEGRINKSTERAKVMFLFDEDGAAAIITELIALASRMGPEFDARLKERMDALIENGHVGPQPSPQPVDELAFRKAHPEEFRDVNPN